MVRVLQIVRGMGQGGIENFIMNLYREMDREKIQFDFLIQVKERTAFEDEIKSLGGRIYRIPYITDVGYFKWKKELYHFFKEHSEYKIIHSHLNSMSGPVLLEAKKTGIPMRIAHAHIGELEGGFLMRLERKILQRNIPRDATNLLACSRIAAECIFAQKYGAKAQIIHNAIPLEKFAYNEIIRQKIREQWGVKNELVIGHVGRFNEQKNHTKLIDIFYEVQKKREDSILVLIGDGILKKNIEQKVKLLGIEEKVRFLGICDNVNELMQGMDVFLFPSLFEGLGIVLIEAQMAGLPCVVSNKIPKEAFIGSSIYKVGLDENVLVWRKKILSIKLMSREKRKIGVNHIEYNIQESKSKILNIYCSK